MDEPDLTTEAGKFANGMDGALGNIQCEIEMMTNRLENKTHLYPGLEATYRGMLAGYRICETALLNAMKEQGETP